jgi:hypothetical protein
MELDEFYETVTEIMHNVELIPLENGNSYTYLGPTSTKINGEEFRAFLYEISPNNQKRVTINLVHSTYLETLRSKKNPSRAEVYTLFPLELCSRPCNYTVALFIVLRILENN